MAKSKRIKTISLDSCCLIGLIKGEEYYAPLLSLLDRLDDNSVKLILSPVVLAEVLPNHNSHLDTERKDLVTELLESSKTNYVDVTPTIARLAADLRERQNNGEFSGNKNMSTVDTVILATAILSEVDVLFTGDKGIPKVQFGETQVSEPFDMEEPNLFNQKS